MLVRVSDPSFVDDLLAACREVGLDAHRDGRGVVVPVPDPPPGAPPTQFRDEAVFFIRAWAHLYPGLDVTFDP